MRLVAVIITLFLIAVGAFIYIYYVSTAQVQSPPSVQTTPLPSTSIPLPQASASADIPTGWKLFTSPNGYSLSYPADMTTDTMAEGERFYKHGPTQSKGTELYDGISLLIRTGSLGNLTLEQLAQSKHEQMKNDPTTQTITDVKPVTYGNNRSYQFRQSSLGEGDFIYFQKSNTEYLEVINMTVEPAGREQTFQKVVEQMLASISF